MIVQYMGGKARIAKHIVSSIMSDTPFRERWFEPFVGGGNVMEHAAPHFHECIGADAHPDLILMWQAVTNGWLPPDIDREMYRNLRHADPSALRGFVGFGASFGGKWFGGYGVSPRDGELWRQSARTIARQAQVFMRHRVKFVQSEFGSYDPPPRTVVYCDPPYYGTTSYSTGQFDYQYFYEKLIEWSDLGCAVYVSEYQIPESVPCELIWERSKNVSLNSASNSRHAVEKLYRIQGRRAVKMGYVARA